GADVLLDGDSAFAASAVSDLRTLPEHARAIAKALPALVRKMSSSVGEKAGRMIWIDCEMTGLDFEKQTLVEIATIVTDKDLKIIAEGPDIVIHQSEKVLDRMEEWPRETFTKNGLLKRIRESTVSLSEAEDMVGWFS
ncbi:unnamed protein product, partial [Cylicostephanus goldi]